MLKNLNNKLGTIFILVLIIGILAIPIAAQREFRGRTKPPLAEDTYMQPHDFTFEFYSDNGIIAKSMLNRMTGTDFRSVISPSSNPAHSNVRVLITLPAYGTFGEIRFWTPLGEITDESFTDDINGSNAKEILSSHALYIFPKFRDPSLAYGNHRQAALIDESHTDIYDKGNPLGLRTIVLVNYTEKAFTKDGFEMMSYMTKKNGLSLDGTPLIRSIQDLWMLQNDELVTLERRMYWDDTPIGGPYAVSPVIEDPTNGAIADDAFLMTVLNDGKPLPDEAIFLREFQCLQKTGQWCEK